MASSYSYYTENLARDTLYKNLDLRFKPHPLTGNINPIKEVEAVKRSLINLVMTEPGQKPFRPSYGTPVNGLLFNLMFIHPHDVKTVIETSIKRWEPRCELLNVEVKSYPEDHAVDVVISFTPKNLEYRYETEISLKRTL